jgi:hypothetical protein
LNTGVYVLRLQRKMRNSIKRVIFQFVFVLCFSSILFRAEAWGTIYTVCSSTCDETTVQAAFARHTLSPGDIVELRANIPGGTKCYNEQVVWPVDDRGSQAGGFVTLRGRKGDTIILGGGTTIDPTGWSLYSDSIYRKHIGAARFNTLVVDGVFATRARGPNFGFHSVQSVTRTSNYSSFNYYPGDLDPSWRNITDVEIVMPRNWTQSRLHIKDFTGTNTVEFKGKPKFPYDAPGQQNDYYVENALELLDAPGEWYLDNSAGYLYYWTLSSDSPAKHTLTYPSYGYSKSNRSFDGLLLNVAGSSENPIQYIKIENITFSHSDWHDSPEGYEGYQTASLLEWLVWGSRPSVSFQFVNNSIITNCTFKFIGGDGLVIIGSNNTIANNTFHHIGANAVVNGVTAHGYQNATNGNKIINNTIRYSGLIFEGAGIASFRAGDSFIGDNNISYISEMGIVSGFGASDLLTDVRDNKIFKNEVANVCLRFPDCGGIYANSQQAGTEIYQNYIHDLGPYRAAIYLDEHASFINVYMNLIRNVGCGVLLHRVDANNIWNNTIVDASTCYFFLHTLGPQELTNHLKNNLIYNTLNGSKIFGGLLNNVVDSDYNLYYNTNAASAATWDLELASWAARFNSESHSKRSDPSFVSWSNFHLQTQSPAIGAGSDVGLSSDFDGNLIPNGEPSEQILTDPGLESWNDPNTPTHWGKTAVGTSSVNQDSVDTHGGRYCANLTGGARNSYVEMNHYFTLVAKSNYFLSVWYKTDPGCTFTIVLRNATRGSHNDYCLRPDNVWAGGAGYIALLSSSTSWTHFLFPFTSDVNSGTYEVCFIGDNAINKSFYIDDASLVKVGSVDIGAYAYPSYAAIIGDTGTHKYRVVDCNNTLGQAGVLVTRAAKLQNFTVVRCPVGAFYFAEDGTLTNSIGISGGNDITVANGKTVTGTYNLFGDAGKSGDGTYFDPGLTTRWNSDPLFVNVSAGDFHLQQGSPCIDAGTDVGLTGTDYYGMPIPFNFRFDIGASEYYPRECVP